MFDRMLSFIAPHYCCGCDKPGGLLCSNCQNYIIDESIKSCLVCKKLTDEMDLCSECTSLFERAWVVGDRKDVLQRVIGLYKFERARGAYKALGDLMLSTLPILPSNTIIVPIPTISRHIRERGYDHTMLIANYVAKSRKLDLKSVLCRKTNTRQRQSNTAERISQAKQAFGVKSVIDCDRPYLLIDDVVTTGATLKYAALELQKVGAKHIWVAVIARQTLD